MQRPLPQFHHDYAPFEEVVSRAPHARSAHIRATLEGLMEPGYLTGCSLLTPEGFAVECLPRVARHHGFGAAVRAWQYGTSGRDALAHLGQLDELVTIGERAVAVFRRVSQGFVLLGIASHTADLAWVRVSLREAAESLVHSVQGSVSISL